MKETSTHPRILVSSIDPWSEYVGSDTLTSLLSQFDSSNIAAINVRAKRSDSLVAGRYFHILEGRVIRSIIHPCIITGEAYSPTKDDNIEVENEELAEFTRYSKRRLFGRWFYVLIREIIWKFGHWKSKALESFITDFSPDVFFFPIEGYIHFNWLSLYIIKRFHPSRLIGYMWDDNFTFKQHPGNLLYYIHRIWLHGSVKQLVKKCDVVLAINPKMKKEIDASFGINSVLLTKPVKTVSGFSPVKSRTPIRMVYSGKLIIGRDRTLADIVDAIQVINSDEQKVVLHVYSGTSLSKSIKKRLSVSDSCILHGFISQQDVLKEQQNADVLLFLESLSNRDKSARLSFSTKITDYLSAGKCIWAVGNDDLAPIDYLKQEDAAIVSTSRRNILSQLHQIVNDSETIPLYAQKAYNCGILNHNVQNILTEFRDIILGR